MPKINFFRLSSFDQEVSSNDTSPPMPRRATIAAVREVQNVSTLPVNRSPVMIVICYRLFSIRASIAPITTSIANVRPVPNFSQSAGRPRGAIISPSFTSSYRATRPRLAYLARSLRKEAAIGRRVASSPSNFTTLSLIEATTTTSSQKKATSPIRSLSASKRKAIV